MAISIKKNDSVIALELEIDADIFVVSDSNTFTFKRAQSESEMASGSFYVVNKSLIDKFDVET